MNISEFLSVNCIKLPVGSKTKNEVIVELVEVLTAAGKLTDPKKVLQAIMDREEMGTTGIGQGIAIPHGKTDLARELGAALGISRTGIPFEALDGEPVHLIFLLVSPEWQAGVHLKALARISTLLKDKFFRKSLLQATTPEQVIKIFEEEENRRR